MKRKIIILMVLIASSCMLTMQRCSKDNTTFTVFKAPVPGTPTPAVDQVLTLSGSSYTLKWEGTAPTWDIYIGTSSSPGLAKAGITGNSYTFTTTTGGEFFWFVQTKDQNNVVSISPTWNFFINSAPAVPVLTAPADAAVNFPVTGALTWTATDPEGDDMTYDVYLGTTATPGVVATVTDVTYSPVLVANTKYYWKVVAKDSHGYATSSVVKSFTTGAEAIMTYTGNYLVDEPAEGWNYMVSLKKLTATTVQIGNGAFTYDGWWASWTATFTLDLTKMTYSMAQTTFTSGYSGIEAGIVDPKTGNLTGTYTVWQNGKIIEQGVHTYTKK
jgi:hypothetical protein